MKTHQITFSLLLALALSSCAASPGGARDPANSALPVEPSPVDLSNPTTGPAPESTQAPAVDNFLDQAGLTPPATGEDQFVNLARQELAQRLKINSDQITVLKTTEITWTDITQGCAPAAGQTLSKGRLSGYRIWLQANGANYALHVGLDGKTFLCPN